MADDGRPLVRFDTADGSMWIKPAQVGAVVDVGDGTCVVTLANGSRFPVPTTADAAVKVLWPEREERERNRPATSGNGKPAPRPARPDPAAMLRAARAERESRNDA